VTTADVLGGLARLAVAGVLVPLDVVEVRRTVAVGIDHAVEVPAPGLGAPGVLDAALVTRFVVVAEDRHREDRVGRTGGRLLAAAEGERHALRRPDDPVLAVVVAVVGVLLPLDPPPRVLLGPPDVTAGGLVLHELGGGAFEGQHQLIAGPAQVAGVAAVVRAAVVPALQVRRVEVPAEARPRGLGVLRGGHAVDGLRRVAQVQVGCLAGNGCDLWGSGSSS